MFSRRDRESYLEIDHRESPGLTEAEANAIPGLQGVAVGKGQHFKSPAVRCAHCPRQIILRPDRSRARNFCMKCDHYICDDCALLRKVSGVVCRPWEKFIDDFRNAAAKGQSSSGIILP